MTLPSNARLADTAYLLYIATGIGSMAAPAQIRPVLGTVMAFCALTLGATLYSITRHVDRDLALLGMLCRVLEAGSGSGEIYFAVGSTIFCWLLLKGRTIPAWLSVLGLTMFAIALAVAAVPEALAAIVTGALAIGMRQMAKQNALVRKMPAVETLGCTTVICSDKTGTLTKGEMTVRKLYLAGGAIDVSGAGYAPEGEFRAGGEPVKAVGNRSLEEFLKHGLLCNDSDLHEREGKWAIKGDPTEAALVVAAAKAGMRVRETRLESPRVEELPFSSERKRMTTIHRSGGIHVASVKGAPELVLARCSRILENGSERSLTDTDRAAVLAANEEMAGAALRVLAVACRSLPDGTPYDEDAVESDMVFLGLAGMMDPPRPEAIHRKGKAKTSEGEYEIPLYVNDIISAFYYARTLDYSNMRVNDLINLKNFYKDKVYDLDVKFLGKETIEVPAGKFECIIVEPLG